MEKGKESTFLLFTWSFLFIFLPLQIPIIEWKNVILLPFWNGILKGLSNRELLIFSDSEGFLIVLTFLLILAAILFWITQHILKEQTYFLHGYLRWFLLAILFLIFTKYGLDKIMMLQFPKPEPNLLLTQLGDLEKDILFWTSMGTSRLYNWITGGIEIMGAVFLLFQRTRRMGLIILLLSTLYIVLLNFSFNIGVKMFSLILVGTLISLNWNTLTFIFTYFLGFGEEKNQPRKKRIYLPILKGVLVLSLICFFYEKNNENKIKNQMMGAYQSCYGDELAFIYINQQDYWIEENRAGKKTSFKILQKGNKILLLEDENGYQKEISFFENGELFTLKKDTIENNFKRLNLSKANINQDDFQLIVR